MGVFEELAIMRPWRNLYDKIMNYVVLLNVIRYIYSMIKIPITAYVERFFANEFGAGPYRLDEMSRHALRLEFLSVEAHASAILTVHTLGSCFVQIEGSARLRRCYAENETRFDRGVFGVNLFYHAFFNQVSALAPYVGTVQQAIEIFLDKYGITEDDYPQGHAWRQYLRMKDQREKQTHPSSRGVVVSSARFAVKVAPPVFRLAPPFFSTPNRI